MYDDTVNPLFGACHKVVAEIFSSRAEVSDVAWRFERLNAPTLAARLVLAITRRLKFDVLCIRETAIRGRSKKMRCTRRKKSYPA